MKSKETLFIFFFLIIIFAGCAKRSTEIVSTNTPINHEISFETLDQKERPVTTEGFKSEKLSIILITNKNDIHLVENLVSENAFARLQSIDFSEYLCIAVFQGIKPTNGYKVTIEKVVRNDNSVIIQATLLEPGPDIKKADVITSPYHLIKIKKGNDLKGSFKVILVTGNQEFFSKEMEIP